MIYGILAEKDVKLSSVVRALDLDDFGEKLGMSQRQTKAPRPSCMSNANDV